MKFTENKNPETARLNKVIKTFMKVTNKSVIKNKMYKHV
jgi:hypothetical protein